MQCKSTILIGECVHGSSSYPFTFPLTSRNMAASMHIRWETEINYTMATRSSSLFNRNQDTTSEQLLISEEKNHWIRIPKSWVALEDSLLTMTAVTTWTMGRADQTRNLNFLLEMYNIRQTVRWMQAHTTVKDPAVRTTYVKYCCSFGQPVRYCTRQDQVDKP